MVPRRAFLFTVAIVMVSLAACSSDDKPKAGATTSPTANSSLAGSYKCAGDPVNTLELRSDGTLTLSSPSFVNPKGETIAPSTEQGTWTASGNSVKLVGSFTDPGGDTFTVEGNRLVAGGGDFVCTKSG